MKLFCLHSQYNVVGSYAELLSTYYERTAAAFGAIATNLSAYEHYDFEILTVSERERESCLMFAYLNLSTKTKSITLKHGMEL